MRLPLPCLLTLAVACSGPSRRRAVSIAPPADPASEAGASADALPLGRWYERRSTTPDRGPARAGEELWRLGIDRPVLEALGTDGEQVWASVEGEVLALGPGGAELWRADVRAQGAVIASDEGPAVASSDGVIVVLRPTDGITRRAWPTGGDVAGSPVSVGGELAWVTRAGSVVAASGWVVDTGVRASGGGASDGETLFFGGREGVLLAVGAGAERWRVDLPGPAIGHPVVNGGRVLVAYGAGTGHSGGVSMRDGATGEELWRWAIGFEPAAPPAWGGAIFVPDMGGVLRALDPEDGAELWRTSGQTAYSATPIATPLSVYAVEVTGRVTRLDPDDGGEVWVTDLASAATGTPAVLGDTLVVGLANGAIVGLGAAAP